MPGNATAPKAGRAWHSHVHNLRIALLECEKQTTRLVVSAVVALIVQYVARYVSRDNPFRM
jgi:hypothetical protein